MQPPPRVRVPHRVFVITGIAGLAALCLFTFGALPGPRWPPLGEPAAAGSARVARAARAAEQRMADAARVIYAAKREAGVFVQSGAPPEEAAFVGSELTPLVTTLGSLDAKQLATSPAWARRLAIELAQAGVGRRSVVAAAFSGSFPALNVAVVCAAQALEADVLAVSSVTASAWGATDPGFTWPEIEARLVASRLMAPASVAISVGGDGDTGQDLEPDGRTLAEGIAARTAAALGATALAPSSLAEAVRQRLAILDRRASGRRIAAFVNVGGTSASLGRDVAVLRLQSGWIDRHARVDAGDGLLAHYARRGVPVLHLLNIRDLAIRWQIAARTHLEDRQQ